MRAFRPGAMIVFIRVWPVLKSLPAIGTPLLARELRQGGDVDATGSGRRWRTGCRDVIAA